MKVILLQDVRKQGKKGDVIEVAAGYGQNYLIKNGLAKEATPAALNQLKAKEKANKERELEELEQAKEIKKELDKESTVVEIKAKAGEDGRLFGTVTPKQVAEALQKQFKIKVDRRKMHMKQNLASLGYHNVDISLHSDVPAKIRVHVVEQ
ncbi:50S ribosomal protein L9 [Dolosicoccus paucivorans]|uniref:Large ribosomal subunit protein bL9 n=1 Tax=Dolosicoccus paucivorans TaxID=84521 RepID=A0A1G8K6I4_9LACT|nr:50S ribosomal protein L9 [Dolosicoccus paucivorans]PMB84728.1 50S ribosomal protein L9 [Dolosicoccus paucivorans]PMC58803.1 50S ribosomal protein L9 [Dolosicoccus paucivorans]SDI39032.1 LSU ribosomal protein L9P [Dolosicoccus paucivorans]